MHWAVVFWHAEPERAGRLVKIVNDVEMLHIPMTTTNGGYKEGVCQYSYMSIEAQLSIAVLYAKAFGEVWPSMDMDRITAMAQWQLDSYDTAGMAIDFGDAHQCRGMVRTTLHAALAPIIVAPSAEAAAAAAAGMPGGTMDPCQLRSWASKAYYVNAYNPFNYYPALAVAKHSPAGGSATTTWNALAAECEANSKPGTEPLGPATARVYPELGYALVKMPMLTSCSASDAARWECFDNDASDPDLRPRLRHQGMYSMLALQGRPNSFPHSEVDFATFKWSAFGVTLLGELGYGTISTSIGTWDLRRYIDADNNPSGHNTVIVREAYLDDSEDINYSQMTHEEGTTSFDNGDGNGGSDDSGIVPCIHLDGSNVYGATVPNGWFQYMQRWACPFPGDGGHYMIVDTFAVKPNRTTLYKYGSINTDGFDFQESGDHVRTELTVDEYFHSPTWLNGRDISVMSEEQMKFPANRAENEVAYKAAIQNCNVLIAQGTFSGTVKECTDAEGLWSSNNAQHVEPQLVFAEEAGGGGGNGSSKSTVVELVSKTGFDSDSMAEGDAVGRMRGWSMHGGHFVVDGLATGVERWGSSTLHQHRFRYVSDANLTVDGDMRAFLLTTARAPDTPPPTWLQGCGDGREWCVSACVGTVRMDVSLAETTIEVDGVGGGSEGKVQQKRMVMTKTEDYPACDGNNAPPEVEDDPCDNFVCGDDSESLRQRGFRFSPPKQ